MIRKYKGGGCGCGASRSLGFPLTGGQNANVTRFNGNGLFPNSRNGGNKMPMANSFIGGQVETPLVATQTPMATTYPSATSIVNNPVVENSAVSNTSTMVNTSTAPTNGLNTGGIMGSIASAFGMNKPKSNSLVTTGGRRTKRSKKSRKTKKSKKSKKSRK